MTDPAGWLSTVDSQAWIGSIPAIVKALRAIPG